MTTVNAKLTAALTAKGAAKIAGILASALDGVQVGMFFAVETMRTRAAEIAPNPNEEAALLSTGTAIDQWYTGEIGSPWSFMRTGTIPVQEAILTDPIEIERSGTMILGSTGSPSRINPRTGFSWSTRQRGIQGPTLPYNQAWLQALEFGGAWQVTPRGTEYLEPEPGFTVQAMHKTVAPRAMYLRARVTGRGQAQATVTSHLRQHVRAVGLI